MSIKNFIPEVWTSQILVTFQDESVLRNTVATEYEGDARVGNLVRVTEFEVPEVIDYAEGNGGGPRTIEPQELTASNQDILIDQEKAFAFFVDDVDRRQAAGGLETITRDAALALRNSAESYIAGLMADGGTDVDSTSVMTGDEAFDVVAELRTQLSTANVPLDGRTLAVNPEFSRYLLGADSKLTNVDNAGDAAALRAATLGNLLGFRVVESNHVGAGSGLPTAYAYHRSAVGFVHQISETEAVRDTRRFADIVRGLAVYGGKVLRPEAVLVFQATAAS